MRSRTSQQAAAGSGPKHAEIDARLTAELASVVAGARRRAVRDGDRQIDTAHLLHALLESDPGVRAVFEDGQHLARLLGYLVQRSIGYGLRWQSAAEVSRTAPVTAPGAGWSPVAAEALEHACERAGRRGDAHPRGLDLLAAVLVDPRSRAAEVIARVGVDAAGLAHRIEAAAADGTGTDAASDPASDPEAGGVARVAEGTERGRPRTRVVSGQPAPGGGAGF
ncbi:Clp protease N-terminal domain-containing protein [Streptomyces sp. NPDC008313]|uniref:Clp protease N-terminal domain-containing protein n=1 Tax=Streptomyces sp. NPDC008313 TaxID=3364826 RepID=UPI0036ED363E